MTRNENGFSFVELLVVSGVVFILLNGITLALAESGRRMWVQSDAEMGMVGNAQRALLRMEGDLRNARRDGLTCVTTASTVCTSPPCLEFNPVDGGARITYQRTSSRLLTRTTAGSPPQTRTVAGGISEFAPLCQANGVVKLRVTSQVLGSNAGTPYVLASRSLQTQAFVQNP